MSDFEPVYISREDALKLALMMYLGEHCKYCGKEFAVLDDLRDAVWAGYHERGRLACEACWDAHNSPSS